jgi:hypothetical protein
MPDAASPALFIPMFGDFAEPTRAETHRWFDLDHVPQRLSCPGFLRAERYALVDEAAGPGRAAPLRYVNVYYIEHPRVLESEAYRRQVATRTPWTTRRQGGGVTGTLLRGVWVKQPSPWEDRTARLLPLEGPRTLLVRMLEVDDEDVAGMLSCPGLLGAERYQSVAVELPGPPAAPPPRFMTIYDLENPEVVSTEAYRERATAAEWQGVYLQRPSPWTIRPRVG